MSLPHFYWRNQWQEKEVRHSLILLCVSFPAIVSFVSLLFLSKRNEWMRISFAPFLFQSFTFSLNNQSTTDFRVSFSANAKNEDISWMSFCSFHVERNTQTMPNELFSIVENLFIPSLWIIMDGTVPDTEPKNPLRINRKLYGNL